MVRQLAYSVLEIGTQSQPAGVFVTDTDSVEDSF
jgi:hypothetical protein